MNTMRLLHLVSSFLLLAASPSISAAVQIIEDEAPSEDETVTQLDWRLDPKLSYSDYALEIISVSEGANAGARKKRRTLYNVHKNILSVGVKKSDYFAKLFQQKSPEPTPIELPKLAADRVPIMLDYIYGLNGGDPLQLTTETASALYYLGEVFQVRKLVWEARNFWQKNLLENSANYLIYYEHAKLLGLEPILQAVARVRAFQLLQRQTPEKIMQMANPEFWLQVLQITLTESDGIFMSNAVSLHASTLTARICSRSRDMDEQLFLQITDAKYLPRLDPQAARTLLELEEIIVKSKKPDKLTSLQDRCMDALTDAWQAGTWTSEAFLKTRSPLLLRELLTRSLAKARLALVQQEKQTTEALTAGRRQQIIMEKELRIAKDVQSDLERQLSESKRVQRKLAAGVIAPDL
ncbi:hypothetical protein MPSEU_000689500 [Mayamaea pseudoterrestris]|nr:hypothetical protein MPSEU_000689500 [Mayamaea pseudoterrestris]